MANKKISGFDDLRKTPITTGDADVTYVAGFAAFGTNDNNTANVNVQLSGAELIVSLQKKLDLSQFETGILPALRGGTGLNSISTLLNANVNYSTDGTGKLPPQRWIPTGGNVNQYINYLGGWSNISTGTTYQAGDGLEIDTTTTPDTIKADLKLNGGIVFESSELAIDLGASTITGTLGIRNGGTGIVFTGTAPTSGDSIRVNAGGTAMEYYTPTDDNTTYTLTNGTVANPKIILTPSTGTADQVQFIGSGSTTIQGSAGTITVSSTDTNTTYELLNTVNTNVLKLDKVLPFPGPAGSLTFTAGTGISLDNTVAGTIEITNSSPNNPDAYNLIPQTGSNPSIELKKNSTVAAGTVNFTGGSNITVDGGALPGTITISAPNVGDVYDLRLQSNSSDPNLFLRAGNPPVTQDTINFKAGTNMGIESDGSGVITFDATNDNTTYTYTADGTADPNLRLSDGTTDQDIQLVGGTNVNINNSGNIITIDSTGGGGSGNSVQTLTSTAWNFTLGNSAIFTPTDNGATNPVDQLVASNFPAGARGSLELVPTNTNNFKLFSNSKVPSADSVISISPTNNTIFHYFYDGTTFYWFYDDSYIDPVYVPPSNDPTVDGTNLLGFWYPGSFSSVTNGSGVPFGATWTKSAGGGLIGDLNRVGSTSTANPGVRWYDRDAASEEAPYWGMSEGTSNEGAWESGVTSTSIGSWSSTFYFMATSETGNGYNGILDPNKNDNEALYLYNRQLYLFTPSTYVQGTFPAFTAANNLEDEWIFVHIEFIHNLASSLVNTYIGCQLTYDASTAGGGPGTITGTDGNPITLTSTGLAVFSENPGTLNDGTWASFIYGGITNTSFQWDGGRLGMCAVYNGQLTSSTVVANWESTRTAYYIG